MFKVWFLFLVAVSLPQSLKATSEGSCTKVIFIDIDITFIVIIDIVITFVVIIDINITFVVIIDIDITFVVIIIM